MSTATRYPENPIFKQFTGRRGTGITSPKAVNINRYQNLPKVTGSTPSGPYTSATPTGYKNLGRISTPYGGSTRYEKFHPGVDVANVTGTNIPSQTKGVVTQVRSGQKQGGPDFGNFVVVTDFRGGKQRYSHLNQINVSVGQILEAGANLGTMGSTGQVYSPSGGDASHLDYRIRDLYGKYVNPDIYLQNFQ